MFSPLNIKEIDQVPKNFLYRMAPENPLHASVLEEGKFHFLPYIENPDSKTVSEFFEVRTKVLQLWESYPLGF